MKLIWVTHRKFDDFCATTTLAFALGLVEHNVELTIINPDDETIHQQFPWKHIRVTRAKLRGIQGYSFSKRSKKLLKDISLDFDKAIIDWQLGNGLIQFLQSKGIEVYLMDRSPPADRGVLATLQWLVWKKAWKTVQKNIVKIGFVVSDSHTNFVQSKLNVPNKKIVKLPAGINAHDYPTPSFENRIGSPWKFVYHGRLDKHRGLEHMIRSIILWNTNDVPCKLTFIGDGNAVELIKKQCRLHPSLFKYREPIQKSDIPKELSKHHFGMLPMPSHKIWKLASPLKRGEYLASGLIIVGIDHEGHRIQNVNEDWLNLYNHGDFANKVLGFLKLHDEKKHSSLSEAAHRYAIENLEWSLSIQILLETLNGE